MDEGQVVVEEKKPKFNLIEFARETRREIAKVTWPDRKETMVTTGLIIAMALLASVFFFTIDWVLGAVIGRLLHMGS